MHQFGAKKPQTNTKTKNPERQTSEDSNKYAIPENCNNGKVTLNKCSLEQPTGVTNAPLKPDLLTQHFRFSLSIL